MTGSQSGGAPLPGADLATTGIVMATRIGQLDQTPPSQGQGKQMRQTRVCPERFQELSQ